MSEHTADELEVRNLLARLAHLADSGDTEAYVLLLSEDVVWSMPANPAIGLAASERRGREEIARGQRERLDAGHQGPGTDTMHTVSTIAVEFDGHDRATARSTFVYWTATSSAPAPTTLGRYVDELRRTPDGWKLARRTITIG
jgi:3-phenylpropionate/cinnamic acid dioxygenase small subunit